jgi:hypothetical protein
MSSDSSDELIPISLESVNYKNMVEIFIKSRNKQKNKNVKKKEIKIEPFLILSDNKTTATHKVAVTLVNYLSQETLPRATRERCYWDHHPFETSPLGLPIEFVQANAKASNKDWGSAYRNRLDETYVEDVERHVKRLEHPEYFATFGIFCSFPCMKSFQRANKHNSLFKNSAILIELLYIKLNPQHKDLLIDKNKKVKHKLEIPYAPDWMMLDAYQGDGKGLTIQKFRESFNEYSYEDTKNTIMRPVGKLVEISKT